MSSEGNTSARLARLQNFFREVLAGNREVTNPRAAGLFLEALYNHESPTACVEKLTASDHGIKAVHQAVWVEFSLSFLTSYTLPFLRFLSDPGIKALINGSLLRKILDAIISPMTLWSTLLRYFKGGEIPPEHIYAVVWLALELVADASGLAEIDMQPDAEFIAGHPKVKDSDEYRVRQLGHQIRHVLEIRGKPYQSISSQEERPGGRHDNDHADFRKIRIYPTRDELLSKTQPYYLTAEDVDRAKAPDRAAVHIDNQFRLLREDMLADLRQDLQSVTKRHAGRVGHILGGLVPSHIEAGDSSTTLFRRRFEKCMLALKCYEGLESLKKMDKDKRRKFIDREHNFLKDQSFGALYRDGEVFGFASVCRNAELLVQSPPVVTLRFNDTKALKSCLEALKPELRGSSDVKFVMVDTPVFAYEPVLRGLQDIAEMPLHQSLFDRAASVVDVIPASDGLGKRIEKMQKAAISTSEDGIITWRGHKDTVEVDQAQLKSVLAGLTRAISLIQGPPGTGKSFIGVEITRLIHNLSRQRILVLSYTNHALNQFLEDIMKSGVPAHNIVRIGPRSKCTADVLPLLLSNASKGEKLRNDVKTRIDSLKREADELLIKVELVLTEYKLISGSWREISEFLEFSPDDSEFYEALQTPTGDPSDWKQVDKKGKQIQPDYVFHRWFQGQNAGVFSSRANAWPHIWRMPKDVRRGHRDRWLRSMLIEIIERLVGLVELYDRTVDEINTNFREREVDAVRQKRIMALTTTGAAKHSQLLKAFSPDIVIAEEAGEILESHILTALTPTVRQLSLIGDHKQLRPKVNNYNLSVEVGNGFDLNRSLFERLILHGMPHTVLHKQHRMAPELSVYARSLTYPELLDGPKTHGREEVRGVRNRVIFVNHNNMENDEGRIPDPRDPSSKGSKRNDFEAEMVMHCLKYMGQQGYSASQLVILTPYLGQLRNLSDILKKNEHDPQMSDLDKGDLLRAGLITHAEAKIDKKPIRISTIDNYQGEESDIVIASLTRSNSHGSIGFMDAPERLNVLITRARLGIIIFGNMETFMSSKKGKTAWSLFFKMLKERDCLYDGLPVKCERHPERTALVTKPSEFSIWCPDGGCSELCNAMLSCGNHKCQRRCHRVSDHSKVPCKENIRQSCDRGHTTRVPCHRKGEGCPQCIREDQQKETQMRRDLELETERKKREAKYAKELEEIQDEIASERRAIRYAGEEEDQKMMISQQRAELEQVKQTRKNTEAQRQAQKQQSCSEKQIHSAEVHIEDDPASYGDTAKGEWVRMKKLGDRSNALDALMDMIGLEDVKQEFLSIKNKVDTSLRQEVSLSSERFSCSLLGNPGTGKTTVARLYGEFLTSMGVIPGSYFHETTGSSLANKGVSGCQDILDKILDDGGGVFFIDEAYQLTSGNNPGGSSVLDFLLAEVENNRGKVVFVLAGYSRQMESFFAHNPGIPSRFPIEIPFADYTDDELLRIFNLNINKRFHGKMECQGGNSGLYCRIVARRIGYGRNKDGFGNARAVENAVDVVRKRQSNRLRRARASGANPNDFLLTKEDLIGPEPKNALAKCEAWRKLQDLLGLQEVKKSVQSLVDSIGENYQRELAEKPRIAYSLNKVFLGNPGTGKTTVAKIYGEILASLGLLSKGEVVVKNPADFVGGALGQSEQQTKGILAATVGKVLVIDEAYGLYAGGQAGESSDPYKSAVVDTIVAEVQSVPGDDRCVLLLGYREQLEVMFQNVNPGLSRRFPLAAAFTFDDFSAAELGEIFDKKLQSQGYRVTAQARGVAMDALERARNRPNFGNAGEIDIILDDAKHRNQIRRHNVMSGPNDLLEAVDFDEDFDRADRADVNIRKLFEDTVGCNDIVGLLLGYHSTFTRIKALDMDPKGSIPFNFLFRGPPGTGKTTTARKMGQVFYDMGFLAKTDVQECSATELVGQYVGQTGPKVQQVLDRAMGRVLFIDEAYRLGEGSFCREAIDELVACLTSEKYYKKMIVILAGYDEDINRLMDINPGLSSRFPEAVNFRALSAEECIDLLQRLLGRKQRELKEKRVDLDLNVLTKRTAQFTSNLTRHFSKLIAQESWANARDVKTLEAGIFNRIIESESDAGTRRLTLEEAMLTDELSAMYRERHNREVSARSRKPTHLEAMPFMQAPRSADTKQPSMTSTTTATEVATPPAEEDERPENCMEVSEDERTKPDVGGIYSAKRDAGVSDAVWEQLQRNKVADLAKEEELRQLRKASREADDSARDALLERLLKEEEDKKTKEKMRQKLRAAGLCPAGFQWIPEDEGYRCAGGSHFVAKDILQKMME